ncbi:MAG: hypothetical protein WCV83_00380 [Candidatus Magasanikbacteria bacterium]
MKKIPLLLLALVVGLLTTGAGCLTFGAAQPTGPMGMYQSADKGETWKQIAAMPTVAGAKSIAGIKTYRLHTDPSDPNAIYLATRGQGLYYTYNNGASWETVPAMAGKFIYGLAVSPKDKCTIFVSDGQHIFKTDDCLRTWTNVYTEERPDQRVVSVAVDFGNSNMVYAAELGGDILVSNNSGTSWRVTQRFNFQLQYLVSDQFNPGRVYVAGYTNGIFRSDDSGTTWKDMSDGLDSFAEANKFYRLVLNPGKKDSLFWVSKFGILRSDDAGATWTDLKLITPPGSVNIYAFDINAKNQNEMYYTGTILGEKNAHVRSTFYKTTDGGKNWVTKKLPTNTIPVGVLINTVKDSIVSMGFAILD